MSMNIYKYHQSRELKFYDCGHRYSESTLYIGVELETDITAEGNDNWNDENDLTRTMPSGFFDLFLPTHDGSLTNGCEFVSQPMSLRHWLSIKDTMIAPAFAELLRVGLRAHEPGTCGLHMHVSRGAFDDSVMARKKLIAIVENNWPAMSDFARRGETHYASKRLAMDEGKIHPELIKRMKESPKDSSVEGDGNRYCAVNTTKSSTIEFRFLRGTLNLNTFYASLQFIDNLCRLANNISIEEAFMVDIFDIINFNQWPELMVYAKTRRFNRNCEIAKHEIEKGKGE